MNNTLYIIQLVASLIDATLTHTPGKELPSVNYNPSVLAARCDAITDKFKEVLAPYARENESVALPSDITLYAAFCITCEALWDKVTPDTRVILATVAIKLVDMQLNERDPIAELFESLMTQRL